MFDDVQHTYLGAVEEADFALLEAVARAHAALRARDQPIDAIYGEALRAEGRKECILALARLEAH
jgi:hypothetical protein